jgi:hypothetical protein
MKISRSLPIFIFLVFCFGCASQVEEKVEQKNEFLEVRINRWTALEGGEILVLRKINKDWSAMLLGDGSRFSCLYQKLVQPKSDWNNFLLSLQAEGLLEISDGVHTNNCCMDGRGFIVEIIYEGKLKRYSFENPELLKTKESKQIMRIGDLISREFDTPVFATNSSRGEVGDYLIEKCKIFRENDNK